MSSPIAHSISRVAIGLLALAWAASNAAQAEKRQYTPECAHRDRVAVAWFEAEVEKRTVAPALLAEAAFTLLRARNACPYGKIAEALVLYQNAMSVYGGNVISGSVRHFMEDPAARP